MILVSSCLLGNGCGCNQKAIVNERAKELADSGKAVVFCPDKSNWTSEQVVKMVSHFGATAVVVGNGNGVNLAKALAGNGLKVFSEADLERPDVWKQLNA
ncbi:MAG: DUF523 domain-containing protein [Candidatus Altiarchaeota archaeon]|nr:DUF523 domain-containing protein [Candidatus Altiarchaeota archaeon]